jgi:hypothetical protein
MKTKVLGLALVLTICGTASVSFAGYRFNEMTWVSKNADGSGSFYGTYEAASGSTDNYQYVGCYFGTYGGTSVACWASDSTGNNYGYCQTNDPNLVQNARMVGLMTALYVQWDSTGTCTGISVNQSSYNILR